MVEMKRNRIFNELAVKVDYKKESLVNLHPFIFNNDQVKDIIIKYMEQPVYWLLYLQKDQLAIHKEFIKNNFFKNQKILF